MRLSYLLVVTIVHIGCPQVGEQQRVENTLSVVEPDALSFDALEDGNGEWIVIVHSHFVAGIREVPYECESCSCIRQGR